MFDFDALKDILGSLRRKKLRTFVTIFGIFWGSFMFILLMAAGSGFRNGFNFQLGGLATNSFFLWSQKASIPYKGMRSNRWFSLTNNDFPALKHSVPEIEILAPRIRCRIDEGEKGVEKGGKSGIFDIYGDYPEINLINKEIILSGRFINDMDIKESRKVLVIGDKVLSALFAPGEEPIGQKIYVKGVPFDVVGVFKDARENESSGKMVHIPFTTLQKIFHLSNVIHHFAAKSRDNIPASISEEKAAAILRKMHNVAPEDKNAIGSYNVETQYMKIKTVLDGISLLAWIVGIGTLLSGMVAVCNIMLMIVKERTKEIGIRRAVGAMPSSIISAILAESLLLTLSAGLAGLVAGTWIVQLAEYLLLKSDSPVKYFRSPEISFNIAIASVAIYAAAGVGAALFPIIRALAIKPTEALRDKI